MHWLERCWIRWQKKKGKCMQAALPSYLRAIVDAIYAEHATSPERQEAIELAMSELMEEGQRFCVDFGVCNAIEKRDCLLMLQEERRADSMAEKTHAQIAYEAYAAHQDWKNYQGAPIPTWEGVRPDIRATWVAAAQAVKDVVLSEEGDPH